MKARKKMILGIALAMGVFILGGVLVSLLRWPLVRILLLRGIQQAQQRRVQLLCKTDHQALLEAGREILSQVPIKNRTNDGRGIIGSFPVPKGVRIPQAIRDLRPHVIVIDYYGHLTIEMHGGMDHFGVRIYPDDFKEPRHNFKYGDRELLPGLWYYDDGYLHNPEYDKMIETLIEECKGK